MATIVGFSGLIYPQVIPRISNISPFTYRDGITYQELLYQIRDYMVDTMEPEFTASLNSVIDLTNEAIGAVNNKTGQAEIQRYTLSAPLTLTIDPLWPGNNMVNIVVTQNIVGGWPLTWGPDIDGSAVTIGQQPGDVTSFWLVPQGDGSWVAMNWLEGKDLNDAVATINAALALKASTADLTATNTAVAGKADQDAVTIGLAHRAYMVTTYQELVDGIAAGGAVRVTSSPITIIGEIPVTKPTRIIGGTFVLPTTATYPAFLVTSSNVSFDGGVFTGGGTTADYAINNRFIYALGTSSAYLSGISVTNCRMDGCQSENVRTEFVRDSTIIGNSFTNFLYAGVMALSTEDTVITGNTIDNAVMKDPVVNVYGIAATDGTNEVATRSRRVKITGNTIKNIPWEAIDTHGGEGIVINGNTIVNTPRAIALVTGNSDRLTVPLNCVVNGNYCDRGTSPDDTREGIGLWGISGNGASALITGNTIHGYTTPLRLTTISPGVTLVEGNSAPHTDWTPLNMNNSAVWIGNSSEPPEYMIDGKTVYLRGLVTPTGTQTTATTRIAQLPSGAYPTKLTSLRNVRGANAASTTQASILVDVDGSINMAYRNNTNDYYSYPVDGSFQRDYQGPKI